MGCDDCSLASEFVVVGVFLAVAGSVFFPRKEKSAVFLGFCSSPEAVSVAELTIGTPEFPVDKECPPFYYLSEVFVVKILPLYHCARAVVSEAALVPVEHDFDLRLFDCCRFLEQIEDSHHL